VQRIAAAPSQNGKRRSARRRRSARPRDSQRSKLYAAERTVRAGRRFPDLAACQKYVERVLESSFWAARHPGIAKIEVRDGRGRRHAGSYDHAQRIALPRWARSERIILHELAHQSTPVTCAAHGPEFTRNYLDLVAHFMGPTSAAELGATLRAHRVRTSAPTSV
jgi:putative metallohydrolase (TIGR04338 family)